MLTQIIIAIVALVFSAIFSGYEMAFLHANRLRIALDKKEGKKYAIALDRFLTRESDLISSLLVGNNITLIIYSISMAKLLDPFIQQYITSSLTLILIIDTVVASIIVLITAEYLPKALCYLNPNKVLSTFYRVIFFFYYLFYPITWLTNKLSYSLLGAAAGKKIKGAEDGREKFDQTDLINLSEEVEEAQSVDGQATSDIEIFQNAVDFSKTKIKECLIPRTEITAIDVEENFEELLMMFVSSGYSRILVYKETIDNIIGYVLSKDLLGKSLSFVTNKEGQKGVASCKIEDFIRPIKHVPMDMDARTLLEVMTAKKENIVAVMDEYGGTEGIVTLEDLIEEIFGEIEDELDTQNLVEKKISDKEYIFSARMSVRELNRKYEFGLPEDDSYETLAGLILYTAESFPKEKEILQIGNISLTILKTSKKRIETISLKID
ncbi:MAG: HlyC/CorC family transporter [Bacteroidales bacterium]|nr:HlyC/CorC family transporter [Bacteroidales bacterium]